MAPPMQGAMFVPAGASFPQTTENRAVSEILDDLLDYVGGADRSEARQRALRSLKAAVRRFNLVAWRFNRMTQDITLANSTSDYSLNGNFRSPLRATVLDTAGKAVGSPLEWVRYEDWTKYDGDETSSTSYPDQYTARNVHETGLVSFLPPIGTASLTYPKVRVHYHRRIAIPATETATLNVPVEVEEAITAEAIATISAKVRGFAESREAFTVARDLLASALREHRDFPDSAGHME